MKDIILYTVALLITWLIFSCEDEDSIELSNIGEVYNDDTVWLVYSKSPNMEERELKAASYCVGERIRNNRNAIGTMQSSVVYLPVTNKAKNTATLKMTEKMV